MGFEEFKKEIYSSLSELRSIILEAEGKEENTNEVASQALQATESNAEKITRLEKRIEELEGAM